MTLPELQQNPLVQRVIDIFDEDGNGEVDFKEFIQGVSQFSVKGDKTSKLRFAFRYQHVASSLRRIDLSKFLIINLPIQDLRHRQRRVHQQRRALPGAQDDGGLQPERHPATTNCGQDHPLCRQGQ